MPSDEPHTTLYHGSRSPQLLNTINPSIPAQEKNGLYETWVFATHRRDQALFYTLPQAPDYSLLMTLSHENPDDALGAFIAQPRETYLASPVNGQLYQFNDAGFKRVMSGRNAEPTREWVCNMPVTPETAQPVTKIDDVLESGVQIFNLTADAPSHFFTERLRGQKNPRETLATLLAAPRPLITWENKIRNIKPDKELDALVQKTLTSHHPSW